MAQVSAQYSVAMLFRHLLPSAQARDSPALAERVSDWADPATWDQFSPRQNQKAEIIPAPELLFPRNPARRSDFPAPAAKARSQCRLPEEISPASAVPAEVQALVTAMARAAA